MGMIYSDLPIASIPQGYPIDFINDVTRLGKHIRLSLTTLKQVQHKHTSIQVPVERNMGYEQEYQLGIFAVQSTRQSKTCIVYGICARFFQHRQQKGDQNVKKNYC